MMSGPELMTVLAVLLAALAVLPGTLGVLIFTNEIAARPGGARLIYQYSLAALVVSLVLLIIGLALGGVTLIGGGATVVYLGICVFGFLMHTRFLFRPVRKPIFISVDQALEKFGPDEEVVGVTDANGTPFAFVARLARRPHIVYQPEGDAPFIMTHCILSHSSMAYDTSGDFAQPDIVITAALSNNMVFYEKSNKCSVIQIQNAARDGGLALKTIPTMMMSLGTWKRLYPDSKVWMRPIAWRDVFYLKVLARAEAVDPHSPMVVYPLMNPKDDRLPMKSEVLGVEINGQYRAYPVSLFESGEIIHDELGGTPLVIVPAYGGDYIQAFESRIDGQMLTFRKGEVEGQMLDNETGSVWSCLGECVGGVHQGRRLMAVPHYNKIFWFPWADFHPETSVYGESRNDSNVAPATRLATG